MKNLIKDYDFYKGIQHNFRDISVFIKALTNNKESYNLFINTWAKMFTFDTIIGNTDRHHDNWGLIHYPDEKKGKFSPAFDNGTSMGYEILNDNIPKFNNEEYLMKYINRGTHHARWTINEERNSHASFIEKFLDNYPDSKKSVLECLDFDIDKLMDSILRLTEFSIKTPLEKIRVDFMLKLVRARRDNLLNIII